MRPIVPLALAFLTLTAVPAAALKKTPYAEVKVTAPAPFPADAALNAMRKQLAGIVARKDAKALFALVSPDFVWTADGEPAERSNPDGDPLQNFKIAFGFAIGGKDDKIGNDEAFWVLLEQAVSDPALTPHGGNSAIACGPVTAEADEDARDAATEKIAGEDEGVEWTYTLKEIALTEKPAGGRTVAKAANVALPVVGRYPAAKEGEDIAPSFYELLLPSGKTGWIDVDGVEALAADRLCYGKDKTGAWKITGYEQNN